MSEKDVIDKEQTQSKSAGVKQHPKGYKLYKIGLCLCLVASLLIIAEGIVLALVFPLLYGAQLLPPWGGYIDLSLGVAMLIGLLLVIELHGHETGRTIGATVIGLCAIVSLVLFGGGFYYVGFILGVIGALLTATRES